jgi:hypothetical protein
MLLACSVLLRSVRFILRWNHSESLNRTEIRMFKTVQFSFLIHFKPALQAEFEKLWPLLAPQPWSSPFYNSEHWVTLAKRFWKGVLYDLSTLFMHAIQVHHTNRYGLGHMVICAGSYVIMTQTCTCIMITRHFPTLRVEGSCFSFAWLLSELWVLLLDILGD